MKLRDKHIRRAALLAAVFTALPLPLGMFTGLFLWSSPFLLLHSLFTVGAFALLHFIGLIVLIIILFRHRWFCRVLCPTGALCDSASHVGRYKTWLPRIPKIHKPLCLVSLAAALAGMPLLAVLDPVNLFYAYFDSFQSMPPAVTLLKMAGLLFVVCINLFIPHLWCQRLCPLGGLQDLLTGARQTINKFFRAFTISYTPARRHALTAMAGGLLGLAWKTRSPAQAQPMLRPPGALPETYFKTACTRCGNCVKSCPTKIIQSSLRGDDLLGALTPRVRFETSYCLPDCTRCGDACPSGAITPFTKEQKRRLIIGTAKINLENCLLTKFEECNRCQTYCAYNAIEYQTAKEAFHAIPIVIQQNCTGCGACKIACPPQVIEILPYQSTTDPSSASYVSGLRQS